MGFRGASVGLRAPGTPRWELLVRARERRLPLGMVEKDYVLGGVLCGLSQLPELVFKGGTDLAKVHLPETWRSAARV